MVWKGMTPQRAAFFLAAQAFMALPSHLLFGWIGDRLNKPKLMATCMLLATSAMLILAYVHAEWAILIFIALFSVVESTFPVNWSTVGEYFGRKNFAKIRGSMSFVSTWGSVIGPVITGAIYDYTQSYQIMIWAAAVLLLIASMLYAMVTKPRPILAA
jgi:MFS family permease